MFIFIKEELCYSIIRVLCNWFINSLFLNVKSEKFQSSGLSTNVNHLKAQSNLKMHEFISLKLLKSSNFYL